jgi:membrane protein DedA with SNARE-associated domain
VNDALGWVLSVMHQVDPVLRILLAGIGIFCETSILIGLIVPGDTIVLVAATGTTDWIQYVALLLTAVVGALGGESIGFALGHYFGPKIRASRLGQRIGEKHWVRAENYLDRRGGIAVFISRFLPILHSLIPVTVGMSTMRYRKFIAWTAPACVIWALAYVSVGWAAAGSYRHLAARLHFAGYIFVAIVVVFLLVVVLVKKILERREARHMRHPGDGDANTIDS